MGEVYRATDTNVKWSAAIKVLTAAVVSGRPMAGLCFQRRRCAEGDGSPMPIGAEPR